MGKGQVSFKFVGAGVAVVALVVLFLIGMSMSFYNVPEGDVGVIFHSFGANQGFDNVALGQGWGFKTPFRDRIYTIPFRTQTIGFYGSSEQNARAQYGSITPKDKNGITYDVDLTVRYHLDATQASAFVEQKGEGIAAMESILSTAARADSTRGVFGQYPQEDIPTKRVELANEVQKILQERINKEASGKLKAGFLVVEAVDIRNVKFNDQIEAAIVNKQTAKQTAERKEYELQQAEKEREIAIVQADKERQAKILIATGEANATLLVAKAKAQGIEYINLAYQNMPSAYVAVKYAEAIQPTDKIIIGLDSIAKGGQNIGFLNYNDLIASLKAKGTIS